jgi:hypothetical protein
VNFLRKSVFWIIILVVIGGSFYLVDQQVEEEKKAREVAQRLFSFEPEDVVEFWIRNREETYIVVRQDDDWWLKEPLSVKGDKEVIDPIVENVVTAKKDAVLFEEAEPTKLVEMGLDRTDIEMGIKTATDYKVIIFGDKGPTLNVGYAMLKGEPRVYRIPSSVKADVDKDAYHLRDKTIISFEPLNVVRFEIEREKQGDMVIEQSREGKWDFTEPFRGKANMVKVMETLLKIRDSEIKAFIEEEPSDLTPYGLTSPYIKVSIMDDEEKGASVLDIGKKDRVRRGYFARKNASGNVFLVEEELVNTLRFEANEWKEPAV